MEHLDQLNKEQKDAATSTEGPLLIVAGAGAGKTKTLVARIIHLIRTGTPSRNILAVTFTNKAAKEMRERVTHALTGNNEQPTITTFHSFGVSILRAHADKVGRTRNFGIADTDDSLSLLKKILKEKGIDKETVNPTLLRGMISREKGEGRNPDAWVVASSRPIDHHFAELYEAYEKALRKNNLFDFDDLIRESVHILTKYPDVRAAYQKQFTYIMIDEYQDTNHLQFEMTKLLAGESGNICVVGDMDQTIYSWRGAQARNMLLFERTFPKTKTVFLEYNYRSTRVILEAANAVIEKNTVRIPKTLRPTGELGEMIELYSSYDEIDEARFVVSEIARLTRSGIPRGEIAILFRANFQSRVLEDALLRNDIPYSVAGVRFFERKEVKDVLAYLRAALIKESLYDFSRTINIPSRGLGDKAVEKILAGKESELPPKQKNAYDNYVRILRDIKAQIEKEPVANVLKWIIEHSGLKTMYAEENEGTERIENMMELVSYARSWEEVGEESAHAFLTDVALKSDQDSLESTDKVSLMTVHSSKGLEFSYVFITGMEYNIFPHAPEPGASIESQEEERRLFYVALTRAKQKIFLSYAQSRMLYGSRELCMPSSFLSDIPVHLLMESTGMENSRSDDEQIVFLD